MMSGKHEEIKKDDDNTSKVYDSEQYLSAFSKVYTSPSQRKLESKSLKQQPPKKYIKTITRYIIYIDENKQFPGTELKYIECDADLGFVEINTNNTFIKETTTDNNVKKIMYTVTQAYY